MTSFKRFGLILASAMIAGGLLATGGTATEAASLNCKKCVGAKHLKGKAQPTGVGSAYSEDSIPLVQDAAEKTVLSLTMKTPSKGYIVYSVDFAIGTGKSPVVECRLKNGISGIGTPRVSTAFEEGGTAIAFQRVLPLSTTTSKNRKKIATTVELACLATFESTTIVMPNLIGTFVPTGY